MEGKPLGQRGMSLIELMVTVTIILILAGIITVAMPTMIQRVKVTTAKNQLVTIAAILEDMFNDCGRYPGSLEDIRTSETPPGMERGWHGPYNPTISLKDPWGNPFFYNLEGATIFGPLTVFKTKHSHTYILADMPVGEATLVIENPGVTSGEIWLNGVEIVAESEFKKTIPRIEKSINLSETNTMDIWLRSSPGISVTISIVKSSAYSTKYTLGSYGKDGEDGGKKFDADIVNGEF